MSKTTTNKKPTIQKRFKTFWPLYLFLTITLFAGGLFSDLFEQFALTDFGVLSRALQDNSELLQSTPGPGEPAQMDEETLEDTFDRTEFRELGRSVAGVSRPRARDGARLPSLWLVQIVVVLIWLLPVYKHLISGGGEVPSRVKRRTINLSLLVLILPWIVAVVDLAVAGLAAAFIGSGFVFDFKVHGVSLLIYGSLVSHLNVSVTQRYITDRLAGAVFTDEARYEIKKGFSVSLAARVSLLIVSVALIPLLLNVYIPLAYNAWLIEEILSQQPTNWLALARVLGPIFTIVLVNAFFVLAQIVSLVSFKKSIQRPVNTLVQRMKDVAAGDLSTRSSVYSADEIGALKGHFNLMVEGLAERERIRETFGRYVSMEIAEKIMRSGNVDLGGEEIETTVMFADIRGFTGISEQLGAKDLVSFLNEYLAYMVEPIIDNKGVVNKFIGDAVMAVFSPVFSVEDHAEAALQAGLGMRSALVEFNRLGRYPDTRHGVGVHTGILVAGTVGTEARREYTVIGDTVNVASRIEGHTKVAKTDLLLSEACRGAVDDTSHTDWKFGAVEPVLLRGKSHPMTLFTLETAR